MQFRLTLIISRYAIFSISPLHTCSRLAAKIQRYKNAPNHGCTRNTGERRTARDVCGQLPALIKIISHRANATSMTMTRTTTTTTTDDVGIHPPWIIVHVRINKLCRGRKSSWKLISINKYRCVLRKIAPTRVSTLCFGSKLFFSPFYVKSIP